MLRMLEILLICVMAILIFGLGRLRDLPHQLRESADTLGIKPLSFRSTMLLLTLLVMSIVLLMIEVQEVNSGKQALAVICVLVAWFLVSFWADGRKS